MQQMNHTHLQRLLAFLRRVDLESHGFDGNRSTAIQPTTVHITKSTTGYGVDTAGSNISAARDVFATMITKMHDNFRR
jgi:hypothetical protein